MTQVTHISPITISANGAIVINGKPVTLTGTDNMHDQELAATIAHELKTRGINPTTGWTPVADVPVRLWIDYKMPLTSASDPIAISAIEQKFKNTLAPLGLQFDGSGGWLKTDSRFGERDISFIIPAGMVLNVVRDAIAAANMDVEMEFTLSRMGEEEDGRGELAARENGVLRTPDGYTVVHYDENSDLSGLDPEARVQIERMLAEQAEARKYAESILRALEALPRVIPDLSKHQRKVIQKAISYINTHENAPTDVEEALINKLIDRARVIAEAAQSGRKQ